MNKSFIPQRRCIGCMESKDKNLLIRISASENGLAVSPDGKGEGRGFYICKNPQCLALANKKNAFSRNLKRKISDDELALITQTVNQCAKV